MFISRIFSGEGVGANSVNDRVCSRLSWFPHLLLVNYHHFAVSTTIYGLVDVVGNRFDDYDHQLSGIFYVNDWEPGSESRVCSPY